MHLSRPPTSYPTRYQQIAAQLEQELRGQYRCGDYLPPEQQLADRYQVNRHTLRRAVDELVERGWLQRRQGIGILVLMRPYDYPLHANARFSQNLLDQGSDPTSERLLAVLRPCVEHVAKALTGGRRSSHSFTDFAAGQWRAGLCYRSLPTGLELVACLATIQYRFTASIHHPASTTAVEP